MMQILQVISLLLDYPTELLHDGRTELEQIVQASVLSDAAKNALLAFVKNRLDRDLMDWQAEYDSQFERGRSLSLLLFEHLHGESRDRGQAMVNLQAQYHEAGLDISQKELPDYLPLYLEFLSTQGSDNARFGLQEVAPILGLLAARLAQRNSDYQILLHSLLELSEAEIDLADLSKQISSEERDDTPKALDKVWEEEMVSFMSQQGENSCPSSQLRPTESQRRDQMVPVQFFNGGLSAAAAASGVQS
jgi:nitrate reductase delta subunit